MHPALRSWRDDLPSAFVRGLAVFCGITVASFASARYFQSGSIAPVNPIIPKPEWVVVDRPHPAFALTIPEAADVPAGYTIRRHATGGGRIDIVSLGEADSAAPYLHVEVYRPGGERAEFGDAAVTILSRVREFAPVDIALGSEPLETKFGPVSVATFGAGQGTPRRCLGFARNYDEPRLQIAGWFCQGSQSGGAEIERSTLACALDRFTLLSAGSEPKVGALFAQAELRRTFCGQRDPILAATPKYQVLWKALATRPEPRRIGR